MSEPITNVEAAVRELGALPVPVGPEPLRLTPVQGMVLAELIGDVKPASPKLLRAFGEAVRDCREHDHPKWEDLYCLNLATWMGERAALVLQSLLDAEAENARLRTRVAELEAERHTTNEALDDAVQALREQASRPSRFKATPAEVDTYLRTILAEDAYLSYQQAIGEHAISQTVEDAGAVRTSADNDGLFNNDWREGWDDAIERVDPERNGPYPAELVSLEDPHDSPLHHDYRVSRDLPEMGGV